MRIILSRKGFDTQYGKQASPILEDGTLLSLPIPAKNDQIHFSELCYKDKSYLQIIRELKPATTIKDYYKCHLDPDIRQEAMPRQKDWRPLFGQKGAALGHLIKHDIKEGDIFLFFGWFRETETKNGLLSYKAGAPDLHLIYAYFQIGKIYDNMNDLPEYAHYHPHAQWKSVPKGSNRIFEASASFSLNPSYKGAAPLTYHPKRVLTKPACSKSKWHLPDFFRNLEITYHTKDSFKDDYFQSASKGQEFIIEECREVVEWVRVVV